MQDTGASPLGSRPSVDIGVIRGNIANGVLIVLAIISIPAVIGSLWRIQSIGWQAAMGFHVALAAIVIAAALARNRLPYLARAIFIVAAIFIIGVVGFISFGLSSGGQPMFVLTVVMATVLLGTLGGIVWAGACCVVIILMGYAFSSQWIVLNFDADAYNIAFGSWMGKLSGFLLLSSGTIATIFGLNKALLKLVSDLQSHGDRLEDEVAARTKSLTREIEDRERKEKELAASEARFRQVFEAAGIGMAVAELDGRLRDVNPMLCTMLGYSRDELLNMTIDDITSNEDLEKTRIRRQERADGKLQIQTAEKRYARKDGSIIWGLSTITTVQDDYGRPLYSIGQIQDISKTKEIDNLKSEFVSVVSHELRTPLTSIKGALGLLASNSVESGLNTEGRSVIDIALRNTDRLVELVNDILDFEKLSSGATEFHFQNVDVNELAREAVTLNKPYADTLNVAVELNCNGHTVARGDPDRLNQVMSNLLSNAAKFSPAGSSVDVSVKCDGSSCRIEVADRGIGIPYGARDQIFEPFFQVETGDQKAVKGSGLGLSICRSIIEAHSGTIGYQPREGGGSVFHFEIPMV